MIFFFKQNEQFKAKYNALKETIEDGTKPLIITEGETDWKHLKTAQQALNLSETDFAYYEFNEPFGDVSLLKLLENYARIPQTRRIIGIFDRDNPEILRKELKDSKYISLGNNVYMFAIPLVNEAVYGSSISIEHYYPKDTLLKKNAQGRRLFIGSEFNDKGRSLDNKYITRAKGIKNKVSNNGIIDKSVYELTDVNEINSLAMTKNDFAEFVASSENDGKIDFSKFQNIFDVITDIINEKVQ